MSDWTRRFFREDVFTPGMPEALAAAPAEAAFLWKTLRLKKGARVLDVACGTGRHAALLSRRGADVTGADVTAAYLTQARKAAPRARFVRADMRRLPFRGGFDAAYNVWTSFGYFARPSDDLAALRSIARALEPGGLFLIDLLDHAWLEKNFKPRNWARLADGGYRLEETRLVDGADPRMDCAWTVLREGKKPARARFVLRAYDERRLRALLRRAGFRVLRRFRALDGAAEGPRLVLLASRQSR